jgi:hypothetical protein
VNGDEQAGGNAMTAVARSDPSIQDNFQDISFV